MKQGEEDTKFKVAVYYPRQWDVYGGMRVFYTEGQALAERETLLASGHKHVHVWSVTTKMIRT